MTGADLLPTTQGNRPVPNAPISDDEIDLLELFRTLWRGKWWIALVTTLAIFVGGYYAFRIAVPQYTANAVVVLESQQKQVIDISAAMSGLGGDQAEVNTEVEVLRSRGLIEKLVHRMDLKSDPEFNPYLRETQKYSIASLKLLLGMEKAPEPSPQVILDVTVDKVLEAISISNIRQSLVFNISAVTTNPEKSANIVNNLADLYIQNQLDVKFSATEQATAWLSERVPVLQANLKVAATAVKDFSARTSLISDEALGFLSLRIKEARNRRDNLNADLEKLSDQLSRLNVAKELGDSTEIAAIANDAALSFILADGLGNASFEARFEQVLQRVQLEMDRAIAQSAALTQAISELEAEFTQQSEDLVTLQQLQREAEASRLIYEFFLTRFTELSVQEGIHTPDSRLLSIAAIPRTATAPRKPLILVLAAMLGMMLGAGIILLREMQHTGFRTSEQLAAATGHTVLGQIPQIPVRKRMGVIEYLVDKPTSAAAEAVRNLRTSVLLSNVDKPPQVIMVTSSIPGEGKTTASIGLAQNFAGLGKKVLLLEGDIRRRTFSNYFDLKDVKGLLSVLSGESTIEDAVQKNDLLGVDIMIGEKSSTNAADVFSSDKFHAFITQVRELYDIIIIDTPPVLVVPDARVIAQVVDAVLYGVKWDKTSRNQVIEGLRQFEMVNIRVSGLVLGLIDPKGMKRYGYGEQYGAYSSYGKSYYDA